MLTPPPDRGAIACVIYAAKSSEDLRGSIPGQLAECRTTIATHPERTVAAEYVDEAFSAYTGDRGPGLVDAMAHAEDLAEEQGLAELWVQHSDRLARGDGHLARHTVEIALWALKRGVKIRSLQDPDTFRDLLYAVVTGQRNHEDSRRKGLASAAGRRRAVERGEYTGAKPDGYRRVIEVDEGGAIKRRMVIDPARRPVIETIFSMALRGKGTGEIARAISDAGWLTKPRSKGQQPKPWTIHCVRGVLKNTRYAGLATHKGEVLGRGSWPAYISERQHHRIQAQLARRAPRRGPSRHEPYILARLASCGRCGSPMHCLTGEVRDPGDGEVQQQIQVLVALGEEPHSHEVQIEGCRIRVEHNQGVARHHVNDRVMHYGAVCVSFEDRDAGLAPNPGFERLDAALVIVDEYVAVERVPDAQGLEGGARLEFVQLLHPEHPRSREELDPRERSRVGALHASANDVGVVAGVVRLVE